MSYVSLHDGENIESLLRRFKMSVAKSGVLRDLKDHRFFRSKAEKARVAAQRAARRNRSGSTAR
ncbi:MAG: 30S ribosomal protein S21 [Dehalococcoidia bacterium]|nr:30S ribosomal protein S21 [Dehalococcoidia bacterium]